MWELIIDLVFNVVDGVFSLGEDDSTAFGCLVKGIGLIVGLISAIILVPMLIAWLLSLL